PGVGTGRPRAGFVYGAVVTLLGRPVARALFRRQWAGGAHFPVEGGFIAAVNHNSALDPLAYGYFQYAAGRPPRFFAKESLFR
ncbi:1-acyl-sn-glycerol-3-phosphate acyltransferase, partial [Streptomyces sp. SID11233]|nr:1-acyl-sn-glycerol-3-phosphate acyltransferase [Streptomyces sp. SID11233]